MYTVKFISETACIMLMDGDKYIDSTFINKFRYENNMIYRAETQKEIDLLLKLNSVNNYHYDNSMSVLFEKLN